MEYLALSIFGSVLAIGATTIVCFRLWVKERHQITPEIFVDKIKESISVFETIKSLMSVFKDNETSTDEKTPS